LKEKKSSICLKKKHKKLYKIVLIKEGIVLIMNMKWNWRRYYRK